MKFQEVARKLENLEAGFGDSTTALAQIFRELKMTSDVVIPDGAIHTVKYAASAAVIPHLEDAMREAANPDDISVAIQLGKVNDKIRLALPGGAVLSKQELAWIADPKNEGIPSPGNLFYVLAEDQLLSTGRLVFDYDLNLAAAGFTTSLRTNLGRELGEEIGPTAAAKIEFGEFLPDERTTTLTTFTTPNAAARPAILERLAAQKVTLTDKGAFTPIYTVVTERFAVAHAPLSEIEAHATDNSEAKGIRIKTLGEMLTLARQTAESAATFLRFKEFHSDRHGSDGVRNPSTTDALRQLAGWFKGVVLGRDTYKEGPRSS